MKNNEKINYFSGNDDHKYRCQNGVCEKIHDVDDWEICPNCNLYPKVLEFDNGRSTVCGCGDSEHVYFSVHAESMASYHINDGNTRNYETDDLKENWNHWARAGELLFIPTKNRW